MLHWLTGNKIDGCSSGKWTDDSHFKKILSKCSKEMKKKLVQESPEKKIEKGRNWSPMKRGPDENEKELDQIVLKKLKKEAKREKRREKYADEFTTKSR